MSKRVKQKKRMRPNEMLIRCAAVISAFALLLALFCLIGDRLQKGKFQEEGRSELPEGYGEAPTIEFNGETYVQNLNLTTFLLMGVDRADDSPTGGFRNGGQADFIHLMVMDHEDGVVRQLQIDRDTMADVTVLGVLGNVTGMRNLQICLAHGYGQDEEERCVYLTEAVGRLLNGMDIELYMSLKLDAIGVLNDAIGGVTVEIEDDFSAYDAAMTPGAKVKLLGDQAELFVRSRTTVGDGTNESRMRRQRAYMQAAADVIRGKVDEDVNFVGTLYDDLNTIMATNASRGRLINVVNRAHKYDIQPVTTLAGEYSIGEDGFMEFHADEEAISAWVVEAFYKPKGED